MEKFNLSNARELPEFMGEGAFTGVFFNEEGILTGGYKGKKSVIHFVIECKDGNINDINLHGLDIKQIKIIHPLFGEKEYIDFCPTHNDFTENVIIICNEILNSIEKGEVSSDATRRVLQKWEYFLSKPRTSKLSDEGIIGLYGELLTIEWFLNKGKDELTLIEKWLGPLKNPRDFEFKDFWVEVKTTKRKDNLVEIHGIEQLETRDLIELYLWVNILEKDNNSRSLVELINDIDTRLQSAIAAMLFRDKLHQAGYHANDACLYNNERFKCDKISVFIVNADFPKITKEMLNLPTRVVSLSYGLNLSGLVEINKEIVFNNEL